MTRNQRGRARTSRASKNISNENKHSTDIPVGSGSQSLATPPAVGGHHYVSVWDPDAVPVESSWALAAEDWNNPLGDNTWEWEAAGDDSIASDDPLREKKLAWRKENDHLYSSEHRVRRWREKLPVKRLLLSRVDALEKAVEVPPKGEIWDGKSGCRLKSRERSRSKGRQGRKERAAKVEEWKEMVESMIAEGTNEAGFSSGVFSVDIQTWLDSLVQKPNWSHVDKTKAKAFFELSIRDKVAGVERLSRDLVEGLQQGPRWEPAEGPSWDI